MSEFSLDGPMPHEAGSSGADDAADAPPESEAASAAPPGDGPDDDGPDGDALAEDSADTDGLEDDGLAEDSPDTDVPEDDGPADGIHEDHGLDGDSPHGHGPESEGPDGDARDDDRPEDGGHAGDGPAGDDDAQAAPPPSEEGDADGLAREADPAWREPGGGVDSSAPEAEPEGPPSLPRGTPLRLRVAPARRPGLFSAVLRAGWEELNYPRARVRAAARRAANRMRERRGAAALLWGTLAGATFILYTSHLGLARGGLAWAAFAGAAVGLGAGGPGLLVHAWPAAIVVPVGAFVWAGCAFGAGALWVGLATGAAALAIYFATGELVPFVAGGGAALLAWDLTEGAGDGWRVAATGAVLVAASGIFFWRRKRVTAPILMAAWVWASGELASRAAALALGAHVPAEWSANALRGPEGLAACVAGGAFGAALFVWPRRREPKGAGLG